MTDDPKRDEAVDPGEPAPKEAERAAAPSEGTPPTEPPSGTDPVKPAPETAAPNEVVEADAAPPSPTVAGEAVEPSESKAAAKSDASPPSSPERVAAKADTDQDDTDQADAKANEGEGPKPAPEATKEVAPKAAEKAGKSNDKAGKAAVAVAEDPDDPKKDPARFLISLAVLVLALGAGEVAYRRSTLPAAVFVTETYPVKMADYTKRGGADVVIVGSSRIYHGANAPLLSDLASTAMGKPITVYNMGIPSGDVPGYVLTADDVLRKQLKRPTLFVFAMSPIEWMCCPATSVPSSPRWVTSVRMRHVWGLMSSATDPDEAFTDLTIGLFQSYGSRSHVLNQVLKNQPPPSWRGNAGSLGWVSFGWMVDPGTQNARATGRAGGYAPYFFPPMHFDRGATDRYFQKAMGWLESAGVKVAIIGTAQARQLDRNHVPPSYYPEYVAYLTEQAKLHDTEFINFNDFPGLQNSDFADGDHLSEPGSVKFSRSLSEHVIVPMLKGQKPTAP